MALRCFIAVEIPGPVKRSLGDMIANLKKSGSDVKWLPPENIHITLKFLGSTDESLLEKIKGSLSKKFSPYSPFYITISGVGCFPDERRPRVVWVGTHESSGHVRDVHKAIEAEMAKFGFPVEEREFSPHLTIGRVKGRKGMAALMKMLDAYRQVSFGDLEVGGVTLMKSELNPAGAKYFPLAEIPFGGRTDVKQG
jgi:2'-5' RNA ligase